MREKIIILKGSVITGLMLLTVIIILSGCAANKLNFSELVNEGDEVRVYRVFGMDCPGCHGGLEKLINKIDGVKGSKANWEKQELKVVFHATADVDDSAIHEAIKQANFTPGERLK